MSARPAEAVPDWLDLARDFISHEQRAEEVAPGRWSGDALLARAKKPGGQRRGYGEDGRDHPRILQRSRDPRGRRLNVGAFGGERAAIDFAAHEKLLLASVQIVHRRLINTPINTPTPNAMPIDS